MRYRIVPLSLRVVPKAQVIGSPLDHDILLLKKKHNAVAYHRVREAQAANAIEVAFEATDMNLADILTKPLPGIRKKQLASRILW